MVTGEGRLILGALHARCALGRAGVTKNKREGDGATPAGTWPLRRVLYRADKIDPVQTLLTLEVIQEEDGWCDAPGDPDYNKQVTLPYPASAEQLWRDDDLYDVVVVLGYNDDPVVDGLGSAIFLHIAHEEYAPTEGCVALSLDDMRQLLKMVIPGAVVEVSP